MRHPYRISVGGTLNRITRAFPSPRRCIPGSSGRKLFRVAYVHVYHPSSSSCNGIFIRRRGFLAPLISRISASKLKCVRDCWTFHKGMSSTRLAGIQAKLHHNTIAYYHQLHNINSLTFFISNFSTIYLTIDNRCKYLKHRSVLFLSSPLAWN